MHQDILKSLEKFQQDTSGHIEANLRFDPDLPVFKGHFPEVPMLPGVMQIEIVRLMLEKAGNQPLRIIQIKKNKFLKPIVPGDHISLGIDSCCNADIISVTARLSVEEEIAGKLKMTLSPMENRRICS